MNLASLYQQIKLHYTILITRKTAIIRDAITGTAQAKTVAFHWLSRVLVVKALSKVTPVNLKVRSKVNEINISFFISKKLILFIKEQQRKFELLA